MFMPSFGTGARVGGGAFFGAPRRPMPGPGPVGVSAPFSPVAPTQPVRPIGGPQRFGGFGGYQQPAPPVANPILGTFHDGGKVKKSGVYRLLKGEKVLSLADLKKAKK